MHDVLAFLVHWWWAVALGWVAINIFLCYVLEIYEGIFLSIKHSEWSLYRVFEIVSCSIGLIWVAGIYLISVELLRTLWYFIQFGWEHDDPYSSDGPAS